MSEAKNENAIKIEGYRSQYGKIVEAVLADQTFCFRRPNRGEITHYNKSARAQPDMAVEHAIGLCRTCYIGPETKDILETAFNEYALAFAGTSEFVGVSDLLIKLSTGEAAITVK